MSSVVKIFVRGRGDGVLSKAKKSIRQYHRPRVSFCVYFKGDVHSARFFCVIEQVGGGSLHRIMTDC